MTLQELTQILISKKQCKDCKFAQRKKFYDWRCTFEDERIEIHPLLPACEHFQPKEEKNEKSCNS